MNGLLFTLVTIGVLFLQAYMPRFLKKHDVFGVYVPAPFHDEDWVRKLKERYKWQVLIAGLVLIVLYWIWLLVGKPDVEWTALTGAGLEVVAIMVSIGFYLIAHRQVKQRKAEANWKAQLVEKRVLDTSFHAEVKVVPTLFFLVPIIIHIGIWVYAMTQYSIIPEQIPTHWGPSGKPDAFTNKSWLSISALPIALLCIQLFLLAMNSGIRYTGAALNVQQKQLSKKQQLAFRKTSSLYMFITLCATTMLMDFFYLTMVHAELQDSVVSILLVPVFLVAVLGGLIWLFVKVGQSGSRVVSESSEHVLEGVMNQDQDRYWKWGVVYVNPNDPNWIVEKRFGLGWTMNFGHKRSWWLLLLIILSVVALLLLT